MAEKPIEPMATALPRATGAADEAIAVYQAMWQDAAVASRTSDEHHPQLDDHARDGALGLLRLTEREARKGGRVGDGAAKADPEVVSVKPGEVKLRDCTDGTKWVTYPKGERAEDAQPGGHYFTEATVTRFKGGWKVSELFWRGAGSC